MTRVLRWVLCHRLVVALVVLTVVVGGLLSYYLAPKQEYPAINPPMALITTVYPGAMPEDVERLVTRKIEEDIETIGGFKRSNSRSVNGLSIVVLELEYGTSVDNAWRDLRNQMSDLESQLPEEVEEIHINTKLDETVGFMLALTSDAHDMATLETMADNLKTMVEDVSGVHRVEVLGGQEQHLRIRVKAEELNQIPLSLEQISSLIQGQAASIPLGEISLVPGEHLRVNMNQGIQHRNELEEMILLASPETGDILTLGQIAEVHMMQKEDQQKIWHEGRQAVVITGYFAEGRNVLFIGNEMQRAMEVFQDSLPSDVHLSAMMFQPEDIAKNVNTFVLNLIQGIVFVMVVVFLGMGLRNSLVVSSAIPLSILMTLLVIRFFDIWIHQISIAALIIALGMLVDNAIVVSDAIQVRLDQGEEKAVACIKGTRDVSVPVFTSTVTTVGAFLPLLMLDSLAGDFIRSVPQIVIIALVSSYVVSVFFIPTAAFVFCRPQAQTGRTRKARASFYRLVDTGIKKPVTSLLILAVMAFMTVIIGLQLGLQFFPKADTDLAYIDIRTELDEGSDHTAQKAHEVSLVVEAYPEVFQQSLSVSHGFPKFYNTLPVPSQARHYAQIVFRTDLERRGLFANMTQFTNALQLDIDEKITGAQVEVKLLEQADPIAAPVLVRVSGGGEEDRLRAAEVIRFQLESIEGSINVQDDVKNPVYEYQVLPDDVTAMRLGVTRHQMAGELSLGLMGRNVTSVSMEADEVDLFLDSDVRSIETLSSFGIISRYTGAKVPLGQMATIDIVPRSPEILKENGKQTITIKSDVMSGYNAVTIQNELQGFIEHENFEAVTISYAGEREEIIKYFGEVGISAIFAVMIVFIVLVLQFGGVKLPLLILMTIPFSAIGSIVGLWIFQQPLSFTALLGMVSLFGIVVNNAIILLDYIQFEEKQGKECVEACRQAVALRLRPILLTTATTVMGLVPLILSGSDLFTPMAISLMAGLMMSTFLTLVVLPVLYTLTSTT